MCLKHLLPGNTHTESPRTKPPWQASYPPPPSTQPPKRAKSCSRSPSDHPTNLSWASATHQILPCSPSKGKAHVNQITTPGNDDYKQSSQPCRERTAVSRGCKIQQPPQESPEVVASGGWKGKEQVKLWRQHAWGPGVMREGATKKGRRMGRGQSPPLPAAWGPECPRQRCALGFCTNNSVTHG